MRRRKLAAGPSAPDAATVATWDVAAVVAFVELLELRVCAPLFRESCVAGADLLEITAEDLKAMGVGNHMHRKKILRHVQRWAAEAAEAAKEAGAALAAAAAAPTPVGGTPGNVVATDGHRNEKRSCAADDSTRGFVGSTGDHEGAAVTAAADDDDGGLASGDSDNDSDAGHDHRGRRARRAVGAGGRESEAAVEPFPMRFAVLRMVLTVLVFFALHTLVQYFLLDPLMGRNHRAPLPLSHAELVREAEAIQRRAGGSGAAGHQAFMPRPQL